MALEASYSADGFSVPHTPSVALAAGEVTQLADGRAAFAARAIAANAIGTVHVNGIAALACAAGTTWAAGAEIWWDKSANVAITSQAAPEDFYCGVAVEAKASGPTTVRCLMNVKRVTPAGVGAAKGTGVTAYEMGDRVLHHTRLSLDALSVTMADAAGGQSSGGTKIYDFPAGAIKMVGAIANLTVTAGSGGIADAFDGDFALGSVVAAADASLSGTEANILPSTAMPQAVAGVTTAKGQSTAAQEIVLDGTTTAVDLYLNALVDDADSSGNDTLAFTGTIDLFWINLGDY
jgi:predicted RecA/RadA family phage recombinase